MLLFAADNRAVTPEMVGQMGERVVNSLMKRMSDALKGSMKENGTAPTVEFCNKRAQSIAKEVLAEFGGIGLKRVTDRPRNPKNKMDDYDLRAFNFFKKSKQGSDIYYVISIGNDTYRYYRPIYVRTICLSCHGKKEEMDKEVLHKLQELYPGDRATGYSEGDLRGMFRVEIRGEVLRNKK